MNWKNKPYYLIGGVIGGLLSLVFFILVFGENIFGRNLGFSVGGLIILPLIIIMILLATAIPGFVIGGFIGSIFDLIKRKDRKPLIGFIIIIVLFVLIWLFIKANAVSRYSY